ncbi:MAG: PAS domain-containing protein [Deltaproteobacteria bacterium]|nr:PAS domain-containing protein [Deltaproteobacteria bacterium]
MDLCHFLRQERESIISDWVRQLSQSTSDRYRKIDPAELRRTVAMAYDGNYSVICNHDWEPIEKFIVLITRMRLERGFSLSEVQKAFGIFRIILLGRLPLIFRGEELVNALLVVNHSVDVTINQFSEYFQGKHEEEMQQLLESLEEKVRQRTEQLYNSEKRYRTLVEDISDGYFVCRDGRLIFANRALGKMLGRPPATLVGEDCDLFFAGIGNKLAGIDDRGVFEIEARRRDGSGFPVEIEINQVRYDAHPALAGVCRDISERRELARKELEDERLLVIGRMATVFAHEIRNSLSSIKVNVRVLQRKLALDDNDTRRMEIILRDIEKLDRLLRDTLLFSRFLEISPHQCDLNRLTEQAVARLGELFTASGIQVRLQLDPHLPELSLDEKSMEIVFDNLFNNAVAAMQEAPRREMVVATVFRPAAGGDSGVVELSVADSGRGIAAADQEKIFEPFFSTRQHGIGLGLSNVVRVVKQHGGSIRVASQPGRGAVFTVSLPWQQEAE